MNITSSWETLLTAWETIRPWLPIALPVLLPKFIQYYKYYRNRPASKIQPLNTNTSYALCILFITALISLISTLPLFAPENIFLKTDSFPLTPATILLTRIKKFNEPTQTQETLCQILQVGGKSASQIYAQYGPKVLLDNPLSHADDMHASRWFLLYAAPSILTPHLYHLLALGIATSPFISGKEGARWRTMSILLAASLIPLEIYLIQSYNLSSSMRGAQAKNIPYIHWQLRIWRGVAMAIVDALLAWMIWLQATGRAFVTPEAPIEKVVAHVKRLEQNFKQAHALGIVKNGVMRDGELRRKMDDFWVKEQEAMNDVLQDPQVAQVRRDVAAKRDMRAVARDAAQYVDELVMTMVQASAAT